MEHVRVTDAVIPLGRQAQKSKYAHRGDRLITGSIRQTAQKAAVAGADGDFDDE